MATRTWLRAPRASACIAFALAYALAAGACSGDEEEGERDVPPRDLIERIPPESDSRDGIAYIDLVAAREALGLPEDADISEELADAEESERDLLFASGYVFRHLAVPQQRPMSSALDLSQATAGASTQLVSGPQSVTVVETPQSFEEITDALTADGYRSEGELLTTDDQASKVIHPWVGGGDGLIAMGGSAEAVKAALEEPAETPASRARDLIATLDAPLVSAFASSGTDCIAAAGAAESLDGSSEIVLLIEGGASADALPEPGLLGSAELGEPKVDGERLTVEVTSADSLGPAALPLITGDLAGVYDCNS